MLRKRLEYIFAECLGGKVDHLFFDSFKEFHKYLFENGLPDEFQLNDEYGHALINFANTSTSFYIRCDHSVPGSIRFEIINQEQKLLNN